MIGRNTHGRDEVILFQDADGSVGRRLMTPVLDEFDNVVRWHSAYTCACPPESLRYPRSARGGR